MEEKQRRKTLKAVTLADDNSISSSRKHSRSHHGSSRPSTARRHTSGPSRYDTDTIYPSSHRRHSQELHSPRSPSFQPDALARRHSDDFDAPRPLALQKRSMTAPNLPSDHIDMDLAYGPIPPPLPVARQGDEAEFKGLVTKVKRILEEADCLHYSATAIIASLQKNPEAMAAVALTLAEISDVASKMAPGVLTAMKGSAPAVFALLASPQFLIAGGVAMGVTIVALGGYKIIKKIRAKNAVEKEGMDEMLEIGGDVSRIDNWRRGIAEVEEHSVGTSVDGEFITPQAAALSRLNLNESRPSELRKKEVGSGSKKASSKVSTSKSTSEKGSKTSSKASSKVSSKADSKADSKSSSKPTKEKKVKKPSPLRLILS